MTGTTPNENSYEDQLVKWASAKYGSDPIDISEVSLNVYMDAGGCDTCGYGDRQWVDIVVWGHNREVLSTDEFNFGGANNSFPSLLKEIIEA